MYNNDKGKTEIMEMAFSGRAIEERERPIVEVGKGQIGYTDTYKCLGDQYDETGQNMSKVAKKMEKKDFIAAEVKRQGSYDRVTQLPHSLSIQLLLPPLSCYQTSIL